MARSLCSPTLYMRRAPGAPRWRRANVRSGSPLLLVLLLLLAACATTSARTSSGSAAATFAPGDAAVFVGAPIYSATAPKAAGSTAAPSGGPGGTALSALRASDGRQVWTRRLTSGFLSGFVADGTLFGALAPLQPTPGSVPDFPLTALRGRDGTPQWTVTPGRVALPLGVVGSTLFVDQLKGTQPSVQAPDTTLLALATTDGRTLWSHDLGGLPAGLGQSTIATSTLAANGALLFLAVAPVSASGAPKLASIVALHASDGSVQWTLPAPPALDGGVSQVVAGGGNGGDTVYVAGFSSPPASSKAAGMPAVLALNASTGAIRWIHQFTSSLGGAVPGIVADDQGVCAALTLVPQSAAEPASPGGELVQLSARTGAEEWHADVPGPAISLVESANALYLSTEVYGPALQGGPPASTIAAYQISDGKQLWSASIASPDAKVAAIVNDRLIATGSVLGAPGTAASGPPGGFVEALSAGDGSVRWKAQSSGEGIVQVGPV